jgi:long-chain acyl-CoA synthetase
MTRLPDLVRRTAERYPDAIALAPVPGSPCGGWSYAQLQQRIENAASHLLAFKRRQVDDRVLLYMEPCAAWPAAFFTILEAGLIAVPLPAETPVETAVAVAALADVRVVILGKRTWRLASCFNVRCTPAEQLLEVEKAPSPPPFLTGPLPEVAILAFTSGSTSQPRAVELTHANLLSNLEALLQVRQAGPGDAFLSMLPPAHLFELMVGLLAPLACGARVVYAPCRLPNRLLADLRAERITHALSVPALLQVLYEEVVNELVDAGLLLPARRQQSLAETARWLREEMDEPERQRLRGSIRERIGTAFHTLVVGGAALDPAWREIAATAGLRLEVGYGLTEASPIVTFDLASEAPPGSAGRPLPGVEVRVSEDHEILVRGPNITRGYFRDPEGTAAALRDGWLHTGDCGRQDADGFLFVTGRLKEALVTAAGETLYPEELEPYYDSPLFAERCVTGLPDAQGNDVPTLFVVPASPDAGESELRRAFEALRAAAPARLRLGRFVCLGGPLPRTALGKIRRRRLAQEWQKRGTAS